MLTTQQFNIGCELPLPEWARDIWCHEGDGKGKVVPMHTMKAYRGSVVTSPLILNRGPRWR